LVRPLLPSSASLFLQAYSCGEFQVLEKVLRDLLSTTKVGVRITRH
jgi:hypothetical protein